MKITVSDYKKAIKTLSPKHQEILMTLYYCPDSTANAKELAAALGYKSYQGANRHIGEIGRRIGEYLGITFETYYDYRSGERNAYYKVVGPWKNGGWQMWPNLQKALLSLGLVSPEEATELGVERLPTENPAYHDDEYFKEGKLAQVLVNRYERNFKARQACLDHHGRKCKACGFDFEAVYGKLAEGFIHVHHVIPLHEIGKDYIVDPINDLVPLCPNCHSVVHLANPVLSIEALKKLVHKRKSNPSVSLLDQ